MLKKNYMNYYSCIAVFNFGHVLIEIYLTDLFLMGGFLQSKPEIFSYLAKCTYNSIGPSGTFQIIDAMCVIPLSALVGEFYFYLYYYFIVVLLLTIIEVFNNISYYNSCTRRFNEFEKKYSRRKVSLLKQIVSNLKTEEWFALYQVSRNVNVIEFQKLYDQIFTSVHQKCNV